MRCGRRGRRAAILASRKEISPTRQTKDVNPASGGQGYIRGTYAARRQPLLGLVEAGVERGGGVIGAVASATIWVRWKCPRRSAAATGNAGDWPVDGFGIGCGAAVAVWSAGGFWGGALGG
jgi:hypothetical protein